MRLFDQPWIRRLPLAAILLVILALNVAFDFWRDHTLGIIDVLFLLGIAYCIGDIIVRARRRREEKEEGSQER
jgi:uncharacterized protein involved in response to NO